MMRYAISALLIFTSQLAWAEILVPVRTIRAREVISREDLAPKDVTVVGALSNPDDIVGFEARIALYPGRPIRPGDIGTPAVIDRNDIVRLTFLQGQLRIATEGRSLGRGAPGDVVRAMNISSRMTVSGRIQADGSIEVQ
jgi:flagellar basal body P-ring formation protein FlgA